ncbi:hypothetical protein, partial [Xanthomonas sacchari]|uniref:hypothetical protein n=1 Tax=Xanthomonas sacchari TaxID=56458 RepID=UPI0005A1EF54
MSKKSKQTGAETGDDVSSLFAKLGSSGATAYQDFSADRLSAADRRPGRRAASGACRSVACRAGAGVVGGTRRDRAQAGRTGACCDVADDARRSGGR